MGLNGKSVLIIDDSDTIRAYLKNVFTQKGARTVDQASSGQEGLVTCARQVYDLILLDLLLPDTDGIEVLKNIRSANDVSTVVMITGYGGIKSAIAAVQMGADGYIEKQDITSTLRDHIDFLYALDQAMERRAGLAAQKQLEQIRADFYAMVTHDLRNPTSIILMATDILLDEVLNPEQEQLLRMVDDAAYRLIRLINDYLDFAKIDAGYLHLDFGQVDLIQVVEASTRFAHLQAHARRQTLTLDLPPEPVPASVDAERLKQVLDNLLSNAIKYTPEGGEITLRLAVEGDQAVLSVSDTGRGIPPEHISNLFTKYHRVPGEATRGIVGTGLGLLIVKEIVDAHHGTVEVKSEGIAGKGTTFVVTIPLQPPEKPNRSAPTARTVDPEPDAELRALFWTQAEKHLTILQDAFTDPQRLIQDADLLDKACRASHTLKGDLGAMHLTVLFELVNTLDSRLQQAAKGSYPLTHTHLNDLAQLLNRIVSMAASEQAG